MVVISLAAGRLDRAPVEDANCGFGNDHEQGQTRRQETNAGRVAN